MPEVNIAGSFNQFLNLPVQVLPISFFDPTAPEDDIIAFVQELNLTLARTFK
jgi:hypothetical protein